MSDIKDLLDEAVGSYESRTDQRVVEQRVERRKQRRRLIAACTALGLFAVAGTLTWTAFAPGSKDRGTAMSTEPLVTQTVQGVTVAHRASWTLVDLWPLARSIATWPEPVGNSISVPDDTPERGGLPVLQLSNEDLGLQSSCGDILMGQESFLYVALNGGPFRVNPDGTPIWKSELSEADGPCGRGWYAYKRAEGASGDLTTSTPYLVFAGFGPNVSQGDREAVLAAFDSLEFVPFDYLRPPAQASPSYVSLDASLPPDPDVTATIPAGAFLRGVAVGEGAVWASVDNANSGPDDHLLVKIDPTTNEIVDSIPLPEAGDLAVGDGSVWVLSHAVSGGAILRIDPSTGEIAATIPVGDQLSNIAIGEGAVWATRTTDGNPPSGEVVRIDPTTNEIVDRIPVAGGWPRDLVIGEGSVWAYGHSRLAEHGWEASSLWRIDPVTNEAVVVVDQDGFLGDGGALPDNAAVGDGYVWAAAADQRGTGLRIDPSTGESARFEVEGGFAWPFLVEAGRVWFGRDEIRLLDTETLEVVDVVNAEIESIDAAFDPSTASLWVANYDGTITRIDLG